MSNVVKEMLNHVPEGLMWYNIFLPAILAILSLHDGATVQAIFFFALGDMRHGKIFLKISTNKIQAPAVFTLLNNSGNFDDSYNITAHEIPANRLLFIHRILNECPVLLQ